MTNITHKDKPDNEPKECSGCDALLDKEDIAGRHFLSVFCKTCWEAYKKENKGKCLNCGANRYECVC